MILILQEMQQKYNLQPAGLGRRKVFILPVQIPAQVSESRVDDHRDNFFTGPDDPGPLECSPDVRPGCGAPEHSLRDSQFSGGFVSICIRYRYDFIHQVHPED